MKNHEKTIEALCAGAYLAGIVEQAHPEFAEAVDKWRLAVQKALDELHRCEIKHIHNKGDRT